MKTAYKIILVNLASLVGFAAAISTLPGDTNLTLLWFSLLVTLVVINVAVFVLPRYRRSRGTEMTDSKFTTTKLVVLWIVFLLGLLYNWAQWHHH
jgi:heme/copper-type cytochrome/quinol oxidase subunit 2